MQSNRPSGVSSQHCDSVGNETHVYNVPSNPLGRIKLAPQTSFKTHRSGWSFAMDALVAEHNDSGVLFDGFLDRLFDGSWPHPLGQQLPLTEPWSGIFHNPPGMTAWRNCSGAPSELLKTDNFVASLPHCRGLFSLSDHLSDFLRQETGLPVSTLRHPTEIPAELFDIEKFESSTTRDVVMVGWWLRRLASIFFLPLNRDSGYRKIRLIANEQLKFQLDHCLKQEFVKQAMALGKALSPEFRDNTETVSWLGHAEYDQLLATSIVFLDLHDASANNAVIECIARATPLLVNRISPVEEYLGVDYPFYFESLEDAAAKVQDVPLVRKTHEYLLHCPMRKKLSQEAFLEDFRNSDVYQQLTASSDTPAGLPI